ncbi:MAG TPA: hypothetical protein VE258_01315, partial [Ktedonobacterales bacterium]|nr:hypothetical protein [Ktedonobacterales bacterium]
RLMVRLQQSGAVFVTSAGLAGAFAVRACIVHFHTSQPEVAALPSIVARLGRGVEAALRPDTLKGES